MIDIYEWLKVSRPELASKLSSLLSSGVQESEKKKYNQKTVYSIEKRGPISAILRVPSQTAWKIRPPG